MSARQQVFVVDRSAFFGGDWPQGYFPIPDTGEFLHKARSLGRFVDREEAEANPAWKQWIPYCMLRCGDWSQNGPDRGVLAVQRTKKGGETRLHESWSTGLGGHIEPEDVAPEAAGSTNALQPAMAELGWRPEDSGPTEAHAFFAAALARELTEELILPGSDLTSGGATPPPRLVGMINDDSTEVGKVHAGLAYCIDFPEPLAIARERVGIREISKMRGGFTHLVEFAELWQTPSQFESWSQFMIAAEIASAMGVRSKDGTDSAENDT